MNIMLIDQAKIKTIIPQREPFIMIDGLLDADNSGFNSTFKIVDTNCMLDGTNASEGALVENIAQTCAAGFGYLSSLEGQTEPRLGFIGAVTKLEVFGEAHVNDQLDTRVEILNTFENIHLIEGTVRCNETELLKCQMKIVLA
jgi:predicted hotdog family 3-hydroxylacyl-ACP dehydratase